MAAWPQGYQTLRSRSWWCWWWWDPTVDFRIKMEGLYDCHDFRTSHITPTFRMNCYMARLNQEKILNRAKSMIGQAPNFFLESHCPDYPKNAIALCGVRRRNLSANISKIWLIQQGRTVHPQHSKFAKKTWRSSIQNVLTVHWPFDWCVFWQSKASSSHPRHHRFPARSRRSIKSVQLESNANIHIQYLQH